MTSEISSPLRIWKIRHSSPGCTFVWTLWVVYFPLKHSCLYNNGQHFPVVLFVYAAHGGSNFWVCWWNPKVWPIQTKATEQYFSINLTVFQFCTQLNVVLLLNSKLRAQYQNQKGSHVGGERVSGSLHHGGHIGRLKCILGTTFAFFIRLSSNFAGW